MRRWMTVADRGDGGRHLRRRELTARAEVDEMVSIPVDAVREVTETLRSDTPLA